MSVSLVAGTALLVVTTLETLQKQRERAQRQAKAAALRESYENNCSKDGIDYAAWLNEYESVYETLTGNRPDMGEAEARQRLRVA